MTFYVYILQSQVNNSFYKGSTDDLVRRLREHNEGKSAFTKKYAPWNLVWYTLKDGRAEAVRLEIKLKNLSIERLIEFMKKYPAPTNPVTLSKLIQP
ncbi:MAG: GIY-YIG nuclease family protein [Cytophagales bacterium]|jgi:putative endonuclease|nr:GIY-YIG nuclease family protein [Cytophagales bacterium]MCA6392792.1 GIY-YIG nuclease family protein [Cytophagales bacterium]MCA6403989.1 GIY-YIG nuclease family protein [Cytophagales bacterium]MCA6408230.1 GIY-YIG nuclease family protein [Cytophagales bacterium]MCA6411801.1 GIY-YIG nuclease family protein [Cytophagales bacterium]